MENLPTELIQIIISYLKTPPRPPRSIIRRRTPGIAQYAAISRQWQANVEPLVWKKISAWRAGWFEELQQFTSGDPYRRARVGYIRQILWSPTIEWPDLFAKTDRNVEIHAEIMPDWYRRQVLSSMLDMFQLLESWKDQVSNLSLSLWLFDDDYLVENAETIEQEERQSMTTEQLWKKSQIPHLLYLNAEDFHGIPTLPYIKSLQLHKYEDTTARPSAFFRILHCFPHVKDVMFGEGPWIPRNALQALYEQRQEVIDHLHLVPESVETFSYSITPQRELSIDPSNNAANYLSSNGLDMFSIAFRAFSMRLRELRLKNVRVSSSFFWPDTEDQINERSLYWPKLEVLEVLEVPPYTSDGRWILENDPNQDWDESDEDDISEIWDYDIKHYAQRGLINSHEVDKLYEAIAHAAHQMPRLRGLTFSFRDELGYGSRQEYLDFERDLATGETTLCINSVWHYELGEGVIVAWGLEGEKADEFRDTWDVTLDQWPCYS